MAQDWKVNNKLKQNFIKFNGFDLADLSANWRFPKKIYVEKSEPSRVDYYRVQAPPVILRVTKAVLRNVEEGLEVGEYEVNGIEKYRRNTTGGGERNALFERDVA